MVEKHHEIVRQRFGVESLGNIFKDNEKYKEYKDKITEVDKMPKCAMD